MNTYSYFHETERSWFDCLYIAAYSDNFQYNITASNKHIEKLFPSYIWTDKTLKH